MWNCPYDPPRWSQWVKLNLGKSIPRGINEPVCCTNWLNHGGSERQFKSSLAGTLEIDSLVQDCSNSSALAMELLQSCTEPLKCYTIQIHVTNLLCFLDPWARPWRPSSWMSPFSHLFHRSVLWLLVTQQTGPHRPVVLHAVLGLLLASWAETKGDYSIKHK